MAAITRLVGTHVWPKLPIEGHNCEGFNREGHGKLGSDTRAPETVGVLAVSGKPASLEVIDN